MSSDSDSDSRICYFKLVYTSISFKLRIYNNTTITEIINTINNKWKRGFQVNDKYYLQLVVTCNNVNGDPELAPHLEYSQETLGEKFGSKPVAFYVRPVDPNIGEFVRRTNYFTLSDESE